MYKLVSDFKQIPETYLPWSSFLSQLLTALEAGQPWQPLHRWVLHHWSPAGGTALEQSMDPATLWRPVWRVMRTQIPVLLLLARPGQAALLPRVSVGQYQPWPWPYSAQRTAAEPAPLPSTPSTLSAAHPGYETNIVIDVEVR